MRTILAAVLALLMTALPRAGEAATVSIETQTTSILFKIHDPTPFVAGGGDGGAIYEDGVVSVVATLGGVTYSEQATGYLNIYQHCYGCYGVPYPFDVYLDFKGIGIHFFIELSYNAASGIPASGGYKYIGTAGFFGSFHILNPEFGDDFYDVFNELDLANVTISAVPIPASGLLLLGSMAALALMRRRRLTSP